MIGKLKGVVDTIDKDHVILDVGGVGYVVFCSGKTLAKMQNNVPISLITDLHVREDSMNLYGFVDNLEREWFRQLITVKGVGTRVALSILSSLATDRLAYAISTKDKVIFKQVSGVGPKLAERIISELHNKTISSCQMLDSSTSSNNTSGANDESDLQSDAISALINLGYGRPEAYNATHQLLAKNDNLTIGELIRQALQELAR